MSEANYYALSRTPINNGEGGQEQPIWEMKFEAHLAECNLAEVLAPNFETELPPNENDVCSMRANQRRKPRRWLLQRTERR